MAKPTHSELIRNLELDVAMQRERVDSSLQAIDRILKENEVLRQSNSEHQRDIAVLQSEVASLKKILEQVEHRRWTLIVAICLGGNGRFPHLSRSNGTPQSR